MIITGATTNVALSMLSKKNNSKIFYINLLINFLISLIFAIFFILFSETIMLIYGENYADGYFILIILFFIANTAACVLSETPIFLNMLDT